MTFVNEVISQEDIEKYELMKIYDKHHKNKKVYEFKTVAKTFYDWVIDKENEIFLSHFGRFFADEQPDHGVLYTKENIFIFYYEKKFYEIILIRERIIPLMISISLLCMKQLGDLSLYLQI